MDKLQLLINIISWYIIICIIIYLLSPTMIFQPPTATYTDNDTIIKITTSNSKDISAIFLANPTSPYTILYSHGNAEDLGMLLPILKQYQKRGFSILAYDYQGYGTSQGWYSEQHTYLDIMAAFNYLTKEKNIPVTNIIALGRSLGTGPTMQLAANHKIGGIILESPFLSAFTVMTRIPLFPVDRYRNYKLAPLVTAPTLVIHGTSDRVIPFWHGKQFFQKLTTTKHFISVPQAGHNDLLAIMQDDYWQAITTFANNSIKS